MSKNPEVSQVIAALLIVIFVATILLVNGALVYRTARTCAFWTEPKRLTLLSMALADVVFALFPLTVLCSSLLMGFVTSCSVTSLAYVYCLLLSCAYGLGLLSLGVEMLHRRRTSNSSRRVRGFISFLLSSSPWILGLAAVLPLCLGHVELERCEARKPPDVPKAQVVASVILPACAAVLVSVMIHMGLIRLSSGDRRCDEAASSQVLTISRMGVSGRHDNERPAYSSLPTLQASPENKANLHNQRLGVDDSGSPMSQTLTTIVLPGTTRADVNCPDERTGTNNSFNQHASMRSLHASSGHHGQSSQAQSRLSTFSVLQQHSSFKHAQQQQQPLPRDNPTTALADEWQRQIYDRPQPAISSNERQLIHSYPTTASTKENLTSLSPNQHGNSASAQIYNNPNSNEEDRGTPIYSYPNPNEDNIAASIYKIPNSNEENRRDMNYRNINTNEGNRVAQIYSSPDPNEEDRGTPIYSNPNQNEVIRDASIYKIPNSNEENRRDLIYSNTNPNEGSRGALIYSNSNANEDTSDDLIYKIPNSNQDHRRDQIYSNSNPNEENGGALIYKIPKTIEENRRYLIYSNTSPTGGNTGALIYNNPNPNEDSRSVLIYENPNSSEPNSRALAYHNPNPNDNNRSDQIYVNSQLSEDRALSLTYDHPQPARTSLQRTLKLSCHQSQTPQPPDVQSQTYAHPPHTGSITKLHASQMAHLPPIDGPCSGSNPPLSADITHYQPRLFFDFDPEHRACADASKGAVLEAEKEVAIATSCCDEEKRRLCLTCVVYLVYVIILASTFIGVDKNINIVIGGLIMVIRSYTTPILLFNYSQY